MKRVFNQKSFNLFLKLKGQGYSHLDIADVIDCSLSTVSRMAKYHKENGETLNLIKPNKDKVIV